MSKAATVQRGSLVDRAIRFLASYGFAVVILGFLLLLTLLGTLEQVDQGLYAVQRKYFNSLFLVHHLFDKVPLPLPGVYLLLVLLTVNLVCGAIIRAPKSWRYPGLLIGHGGILLLIAGGFVSFHFSTNGHMQLYENQAADFYSSYTEWVIEVSRPLDDSKREVYVVPTDRLHRLRPGQSREFTSPDLPFDVEVSGFVKHGQPVRSARSHALATVDGFYLESLPESKEAESNVAGAYVDLKEKSGGGVHHAIVWGLERFPHVVTVDGTEWWVHITRRRWTLPFTILLDKFTVEMHPNTGIARTFRSDVTKIEGRSQERVKITMNEPFRHRGYTLFQANWGPQNAPPGSPLFSGFAVVRNPADQWPLISCIVVSLGLLVHFGQKLGVHLRRRAGR